MAFDEETKVQMRMPRRVRDLIDQAAALRGKNRTQFMTDAAFREAQDVLLDERIISLEAAAWAEFSAALDAPPQDNPRLRELLSHKAPWER